MSEEDGREAATGSTDGAEVPLPSGMDPAFQPEAEA